MTSAAETAIDGERVMAASMAAIAVVDGERYVAANRPYADLYGYSRSVNLVGEAWQRSFPENERRRLKREIVPTCREDGRWRGTVTGRRRNGATFSQELSVVHAGDDRFAVSARATDHDPTGDDAERHRRFVERAFDTVEDIAYVVLMANDIPERRRHERELERQRDELATLDRINELLFEITCDLFESPTRTGIEQTVCDRLAASELYRFAWIGESDADGDRIVPRVSGGIDDGYVEAISITTDDSETGRGPGGRAFRTGEVQVSQDVRSDPTFVPWREAAIDRGIQSAAAVPLVHGETTYGVLAVYATRPLAFSRREQAGFETLGRAVGFAIDAIETRNLLFADAIVELEFEISDPGLVFVRASQRVECELTITGYVASESGDWSVYLSVDGAAPTAVRDAAIDDPGVDEIRVIAAEDERGVLEFLMKRSALAGFSECGARLTSGHADGGRGRFCVEVPLTTDVRRLTKRLRTAYPESTLVAQRKFDRPVRRARELRESVDDRLTDRQREALLRAYHAGYFDWPRRSAAADVAGSMDIAETTFHYHLRNALDALLGAFVELDDR